MSPVNPEHQEAWNKATYAERLYMLSLKYGGGNMVPQWELDDVMNEEIKRQFGYLSAYLTHPEIGPMLKQAANEGWTQERLQAALYKTQFWQTTSAAQREWDLLTRTDPGEASKRVAEMVTNLRTMAAQNGFGDQFDDATLSELATKFLSTGMSEQQIQQGLIAHVQYKPGNAPVGQAGLTMAQVKARASDYGLPMSDEAAFDWAKQVAAGTLNPDAVEVYLRDQAKSRYSWLAEDIDRGATIKQLFDPMLQQTAQLLEIAPAEIDLTDPKFSQMIDHTDAQGVRRSMTTSEAATYIRSSEDWQTTDNAQKAASLAAESILRTFGKVTA